MAGVENKEWVDSLCRHNLLPQLRKYHPADDSLRSYIRLQKQKKVQLMQKALEDKRKAFKERTEVIASRWEDLQAKKAKLKAYMEASEKTLKKNEIVRLDALNRAREDRKKTMKKESEILRAKVKVENLKNQRQKLHTTLEKYSIFKNYLESVVKVSQFKDIEEVIGYYKVLMRMRKDMLESQKGLKEMAEQVQMLLDKCVAEKEVKTQQYKNKLKQLQLRLDQASKGIPQDVETRIQDTATKKNLEVLRIKMAIFHLFQCLRRETKEDLDMPKDNSLRELDMIRYFFEDFRDFCMEEKQKERQNHQQAAPPTEQ